MKRSLIFWGIFLFFSTVQAQSVYPGDVNNNGVVNGSDLLLIGEAFGTTGPPRNDLAMI